MKKILFISAIFASLSFPVLANDDVIKERQETLSDMKSGLEALKEMSESGKLDWNEMANISEDMVSDTVLLRFQFPEGSAKGTDARPTIWRNKEEFNKGLAKLQLGLEQIHQANLDQDKKALGMGMKATFSTCKECHRQYRINR